MLLEGAFLSFFFAPPGLRPRLGAASPPSRASLWLLRYEWFRIYFESGVVKILSGEPQWRDFTAMDKYYENGPLPTWIGWHVQQFPHAFHAATVAYTLLAELILCWLMFFPKRSRLVVFLLTSPLQIGIILTANYAFLNYLVLFLGVLLLADKGPKRGPRVEGRGPSGGYGGPRVEGRGPRGGDGGPRVEGRGPCDGGRRPVEEGP